MLKFWGEEAAKHRDHEKKMVQLYLRVVTQQAILHNVFYLQYSAPHTPERFNLTNSFNAQTFRYWLPTSLPSPPNIPQCKVDFRTRKVILKVLGAQLVNKNIFVKMKMERNSLLNDLCKIVPQLNISVSYSYKENFIIKEYLTLDIS